MPGKRPRRRMVIVSRTAALARVRMQPAAVSPANIPLTLVLAPPAMRARLAAMGRRPGDPPAAVIMRHMATEVAHGAAIVPASGATSD